LPTNTTGPLIYVHIYYNRKSLTKYSARLRYSYLNLAAYIGGVFGLFWGASMLNLAEILAVCPYNHVNWIRYRAAEEKYLPHDPPKEIREAFYDVLVAMENVTFTHLTPLERLIKRSSLPPVVRNISLHDLSQSMAYRCNEIFVWCIFDGTEYDCCKLFIRERTDQGICLVFNSLITKESRMKKLKDAYYPWRVRYAGEESGLSFILRYNESYVRPNSYTTFKARLMIKEAEEWSQPLHHIFYANTHADVMITPILTETASEARLIDAETRNCLFWNERSSKYGRIHGLPYNKLNCLAHCQHKFIMKHCNCSMTLFFPKMHVFNYLKGRHQDQYINDTRRGMECDCIDNCMSLVYLAAVNIQPIHNYEANATIPEIYFHVYYNRNTLTKYVAHLEYTYLDMVGYMGGVLGLFLGGSILSVVEIPYAVIRIFVYFIVEKWNAFRRAKKVRISNRVDVIKE
uniref:Pickpocket protein 19 n=1 Tax=Musca domestica TaxID=7370 RepID=A0A1I8MKQ6_MUSDO